MNTRAELEAITQKAYSSTAYRLVDDEYIIVGKHCRCAYLGNDQWDVWICNPADLVSGLSQRKVRSIAARIADLLRSATLLGIKKRRAANPEATRRLMELHRSAA